MADDRRRYGLSGEKLAAEHLVANGYRILETNYKNRFGEIDIVARDGRTLVFIEVKSRRSTRFGTARGSITPAKRRRVSMVALGYLKSNGGIRQKARFDVVALDACSPEGDVRIEIIKNAFDLNYG